MKVLGKVATVLLLLVASGATASVPHQPLAVMPFKNLNADPEQDWLRVGMTETIVADLKKLSNLQVVERDQVDRALAELALTAERLSDDSRAARLGRLVGAKAVVLGAYQLAGEKIRITARLVLVETGVVKKAAKVTGPLDRIFELQDEVVADLLGVSKQAARPRHARKKGKATTRAYKLYARALSTTSDAERVDYLQQALEVDEDFTYAAEDLAALKQRLASWREQSLAAGRKEEVTLLAQVADEAQPGETRSQLAMKLLQTLIADRRFEALLEASRKIIPLGLPPYGTVPPAELAGYYEILSLQVLRRPHQALQAVERFLKAHPRGAWAQAAAGTAQTLTAELERQSLGKKDLVKADQEREAEQAEARSRMEKRGKPVDETVARSWAFASCSAASSHQQHEEAISRCRTFLGEWRDRGEDPSQLLLIAEWLVARALSELGRFDEAREVASRLVSMDPVWAQRNAIETIVGTWPSP